MAVKGSCLCGAVSFSIDPAPRAVYFCHCSQCRKAQGTAFASSVPVPRTAFTLLTGAEHMHSYRATPHKARWFCSRCGSPLYSEVDGGDALRVRAGALDDGHTLVPVAHIFVADQAPWYRIDDELPQYPGREPGR